MKDRVSEVIDFPWNVFLVRKVHSEKRLNKRILLGEIHFDETVPERVCGLRSDLCIGRNWRILF
jgi:hypothetical protein